MELKIQGSNNFNVSQRMKDYIAKRVEKLNFFKNHITELNFHLSSEKLLYKISANLLLRKLGLYKFEATAEEMYTAIDKIIHKIDVKINREKTKIQDHSKSSHEEMIKFFTDHDENKAEPTHHVMMHNKPATLQDAYMQMSLENIDFYGFNLIDENGEIAPAFLRKLEDDIVYLFKKTAIDTYTEYSLKVKSKEITLDKEIRKIKLHKTDLLEAQKAVLDNDFHFTIFIDEKNKIGFLFKEGNGKWKLIS
jgi:putative sigma-54 modulation protein